MTDIGIFVAGIHFAVVDSSLYYPPPDLHIHLAGVLEHVHDPSYQAMSQRCLVNNPFDEPIERMLRDEENSTIMFPPQFTEQNLRDYMHENPDLLYFAKCKGERIGVDQALSDTTDERMIKFMSCLYCAAKSYAEAFSFHVDEIDVLQKMALYPSYCVDVLRAYFRRYGLDIPQISDREWKVMAWTTGAHLLGPIMETSQECL